MNDQTIKSAIIKIELIWSTTSKEKYDDLRSYEYITNQAIALKRAVMELKAEIEERTRQNKEDKLKYQKLYHALSTIVDTLDFQQTPCKDENYIQDILNKLRRIRSQIHTILEYE